MAEKGNWEEVSEDKPGMINTDCSFTSFLQVKQELPLFQNEGRGKAFGKVRFI